MMVFSMTSIGRERIFFLAKCLRMLLTQTAEQIALITDLGEKLGLLAALKGGPQPRDAEDRFS